MRLDLETEVRYPEGDRAGFIRRVLVDEAGEVASIVMATDDLVSRDVIVPLELLSEEPGGVLTINATPEDLADLGDYEEIEVPVLPEEWRMSRDPAPGSDVFPDMMSQPILPIMEVPNVAEGMLSLSQGTAILCLDGRWGVVDEVLVDEEGRANGFVGRPDAPEEHDRLIPLDLITQVDPDSITLNCTLADLATYTEALTNELEEPEPE